MLPIKLGLADGGVLSDPSFVLDSVEITDIENRIEAPSDIIATAASDIDAPVVDAHSIFNYLVANRHCCTAREQIADLPVLSQSHPAQYVSGIPSAVILLSIPHPIRCSTRCVASS